MLKKITKLATIVGISVSLLVFAIITSPDLSKFAIRSIWAQTNSNNSTNSTNVDKSTMALAMSELAKIHLSAANEALMKGNTTAAFAQMNLAYLQLAMLGMKDMGTINQTQAMKFMQGGGQKSLTQSSSPSDTKLMVPENCIIIQGGVLECRDILTGSYSLAK